MKIQTLLFAIVLLCWGCEQDPKQSIPIEQPPSEAWTKMSGPKVLKMGGCCVQAYYYTLEIDGCEYFATQSYGGYVNLTHKGNCKNPIHHEK